MTDIERASLALRWSWDDYEEAEHGYEAWPSSSVNCEVFEDARGGWWWRRTAYRPFHLSVSGTSFNAWYLAALDCEKGERMRLGGLDADPND